MGCDCELLRSKCSGVQETGLTSAPIRWTRFVTKITINNTRFAEGKAFASAILRQTTEVLANLAKERPDPYFGIMNMYPGKVYLVGGGVPLTVDGRLVGAVGVAGLPQGVDEKAARAGIAAWDKFRENMKK